MKLFRSGIVFALIALSAMPALTRAASQNSTPTIQNAVDAQNILDRCAQAMGAPERNLQVIAEGEVQVNGSGSTSPIRIKTRDMKDLRIEAGPADSAEITIVSNGRGWRYQQGLKSRMPRHATAYSRPDHLPVLLCKIMASDKRMRATYAGSDVVDSHPVFHLKFDATPLGKDERADAIESIISEYHIFIDEQSFMVLKTAKYVFSPHAIENRSLWETHYSDYRVVGGIQIPFRVDNFVSGRNFSTVVFNRVTTDVPLSDQEFSEAN